jgi:hypothetical protein
MLLIQLMTEDVAVEDRGGALHLRGLLPDAQLAAIDELPPISATRESAIAVHMAVARLFLPLARDLSKRTGTPWPDALESALRAHLDSQLGLKLSDLSLGDLRPGVGADAIVRAAQVGTARTVERHPGDWDDKAGGSLPAAMPARLTRVTT